MTTMDFYLQDVWNKVKDYVESNNPAVDSLIYRTYVAKDTRLGSLGEKEATVVVPSFMHKVVIEDIIEHLNSAINVVLNRDNMQCIVVDENSFVSGRVTTQVAPVPQVMPSRNDGVSPEQTFDNFVVGPSNKESHSAALGSAYRPGQFYTPLFIYGNSGLGKTHLLHAIGNYIKSNNPNAHVLYISSSDFVRNVVNSLREGRIEEFKDEMYNLDVLLIDDIQFLAEKNKSHEVFFHIFNELVYNKKQIVITSDRLPTEISGLEDRLISRFASGLSVGVDTPEFETSLEILKLKITNRSVDPNIFDEEVLNHVALNYSKDVRTLEGALNRLLFYSIQFSSNDYIDMEIAMAALKTNGVSLASNQELETKTIKRIVADYYGLTQAQLVSKARTKAISNARHIAIYLSRKHLDIPYKEIGEDFGKRDHSTIISACDKIEKKLKTDQLLAKAIFEIEASLKK